MTSMSLVLLELPSSVRGNGPTLRTLVEIANILHDARSDPPLSLAEIGRRMQAKQVRHSTLRASVDFLQQLGYVVAWGKERHEKVLWAYNPDARLDETVALPGL